MEQSQQSEEKVLKLGKTIINELKLDHSVNTLARWMSHYIAELIINIENSSSRDESNKLKKECCELIIELWDKKERLPIENTVDRLKPIIEVLELLKKNEHPFIDFKIPRSSINIDINTWTEFLQIIKENSQKIFKLSLSSLVNDKILQKDQEWLENHSDFLSTEEKYIIKYLDKANPFLVDFSEKNQDEESSHLDKVHDLFTEIENMIEEQKKSLLSLKKILLSTGDNN